MCNSEILLLMKPYYRSVDRNFQTRSATDALRQPGLVTCLLATRLGHLFAGNAEQS